MPEIRNLRHPSLTQSLRIPVSYLDHVIVCNRHDLSHYVPFEAGGTQIGWARPDLAHALSRYPDVFELGQNALRLADRYGDFAQRSAAIARVLPAIESAGLVPRLRGEMFAAAVAFDAPPLFEIDRSAVPPFGIQAYGVHINGFVRRPRGRADLWIGRRSPTAPICPNELDNLVAGGLAIGMSVIETLVKECHEEASVPEALARAATPVSTIRYSMKTDWGLRRDTLFCYDLELPDDFTPVNTDGEVVEFRRLPAEEVKAIVRDTFRFKFNCNLVVMDFLIRHGLLTDAEADVGALRKGMGQR